MECCATCETPAVNFSHNSFRLTARNMTKGKKATKKSMKAAVQSPPTEASPGPAPSEESPPVQEYRLQLQQTESNLQEQTQKVSDSENKATAFSRQAEAERAAVQKELEEKDNIIQFLQGQLEHANVTNQTLLAEIYRKDQQILRQTDHIRRQRQDLWRQQEDKRVMQVELAKVKEDYSHIVQALKECERVEAYLEKQANEAKTELHKLQAGQTDLGNTDLSQALQKDQEYRQQSVHIHRLQQDLRREQEEKRAMQVEMAKVKEDYSHIVQSLKESENCKAHLTKQLDEAKTKLQKFQADQTNLPKGSTDFHQALQKEQEARQSLQAGQTDLLKDNTDLRQALQKEQEVRQALQAQVAKMESASRQQRPATVEGEAKGENLAESLEAERATVKALKAVVQKCWDAWNTIKGEKEQLAQNQEQLRSAHHDKEQELQQRIQELSAALQRSEEEKTSVLLRSVEPETSLRATENRLQETTSRMEEPQAIVTEKQRKWWQWFF